MPKVTLTSLSSLTNETTALSQLNSNFQAISDTIDLLLSRDGTLPNSMSANLDMNSYRIQNLPVAVSDTEPVRKGEVASLLAAQSYASKWYVGSGAPDNSSYNVSDYYLDSLTSNVYQKTAITTWTIVANIRGATGATGPAGPGSGDMLKSTYDTNNDGVVNAAASVPWSGVSGTPTTLAGYGITNAQGLNANLTAIAGQSWAANTFTYYTGTATAALATITAAGLALLDDADAAAQRTTLGLGTMALRSSVSTGDLVNGAATLAKLDTTGAAGLVLTANGSGSAPSWQSVGAGSSGHVLLATLTPTAVTTLTASSLTLTNYRRLYISINGVRPNSTTAQALQIGDGTNWTTISAAATSSSTVTGFYDQNLENGVGAAFVALAASGVSPTTFPVISILRNANTSIAFRYASSAAFSASVGNIKIYGVL